MASTSRAMATGSSVLWIVPFALFAVPSGALAAQEDEDDLDYVQWVNEYFLTDAVYPQERGEVQLTFLPSFESGEGDRVHFPLAVELGLTDRWQVEVEWNALSIVTPEGASRRSATGDVELSTQYSFMAIGGGSSHVAVGFGVTFPTGDLERGTTEGFVEYEPWFAFARDLPALAGGQIFGNAALGLVQRVEELDDPGEDEEAAAHELSFAGGLLMPVGDMRLTAEVGWSTNTWNNDGDESGGYVAPGLVWDLPGTWELGLGAPFGVTDDADPVRLTLILLYEFELD